MKRLINAILPFLTVSVVWAQDRHASRIDSLLYHLYSEGYFNGAAMVVDHDELVYAEGFGFADFENQITFRTSTAMDAGSITKTITAFSMALLARQGKLSYGDPVSNYLPAFPYKEIEVRHLIYQTSGLIDEQNLFGMAEPGRILDNEFFLQVITDSVPPLSCPAGSKFEYNGINYKLLAMIIERVSGDRFEDFVRKNIALPLLMEDWYLRPAAFEDWKGLRTKGYRKLDGNMILSDSEEIEGFYGDCNLFFSAEDLLKWSRSFYSNTLLEKGMLNTLLQSNIHLSEINALHWYSLGRPSQFHFTGDWRGFYTMVFFDTEKKRSIVYLTNTSMPYWLRPQLVEAIIQILDNEEVQISGRNPIHAPVEYLNSSYSFENSETVRIWGELSRLKMSDKNREFDLYPLQGGFFFAPVSDLWIWFSSSLENGVEINLATIYGTRTGKQIGTSTSD